jgi:hypothetical protein
MREANDAKAPLMTRSGAAVTRLLDMTLFLCEQCAPLSCLLPLPRSLCTHTHTRLTQAPSRPRACACCARRGTMIEPGAIFVLLEQLMEVR